MSELLEGATLRERLQAGPIPVRKAVAYGVAIARGLAAAHERGIIHRDLKPENLFITADDRVKILDFGLAKLTGDEATAAAGSGVHTALHTGAGIVLGTAGYMAPEQVRGAAVDHRADLFALGAVLYELVSGARAFHRGSAAETMAAIVNADPPALATAQRPHFPGPCADCRTLPREAPVRALSDGERSRVRAANRYPISRRPSSGRAGTAQRSPSVARVGCSRAADGRACADRGQAFA